VADPLGGGQYKVTIGPLLASTIQRGLFVVTDLPSLPPPQMVADSQPIDIDVYRSAFARRVRLQAICRRTLQEAKATAVACG